MGLFDLFNKEKREVDSAIKELLKGADPALQKAILMDLEINKSIVKCKKCGGKFTCTDGMRLFHTMAKESVRHRDNIMCCDCHSLFSFRHDFKRKTIELMDDVTHEKEEYLQEKYL